MPPEEKKARCMFERKVSKLEMKVLRSWDDMETGRLWKHAGDDTIAPVRLYIHEIFALQAWRQREKKRQTSVVKITVTTSLISARHLTNWLLFLGRQQRRLKTTLGICRGILAGRTE